VTSLLPSHAGLTHQSARSRRWPVKLQKLAFGGDYNPEQWPRATHLEDLRLMREARVSLATVGVFSWAALERSPGDFTFEWLDEVLDGLHRTGVLVCLATPTAAPPPWFATLHPESLPVTATGVQLGIGARESYCPSSAPYRAAAVSIARELATRYGSHPALALWHVGNEFGAHVGSCYCATSQTAFRGWLQRRYRDLDALNAVWGTALWGQRYADWDEITAPREAPMPVNPAQQLDYRRFSSDEHLACYIGERDALREITPDLPVTTNFMVTNCDNIDYWTWAPEVDVVSNDHYLRAERESNHIDLALAADLSRSLGDGAPWLLMEHSTSAVNWQPRNIAKSPGELRRNSLAHVARGADGAMFFQWRASRFGAEKFHSAMVPQSGTRGRVWKEIVQLGTDVERLAEVRGSRVHSEVAVVWDWESAWALDLELRPSVDVDFRERVDAFYEALWRQHRTVDLVAPTSDLSGYAMVVVPSLYLTTKAAADNLASYVAAGGTLLVSFFSGIVDEHDTVPDGAYPGGLRDLLGLWIDEFHPLAKGQQVQVTGGLVGDVWSETVVLSGAETIRRYVDGPDAGGSALTRHRHGLGTAWYLSTRLDPTQLADVLRQVSAGTRLSPSPDAPENLEIVRRVGGDGTTYLFLINHDTVPVDFAAAGTDLLTGTVHDGMVRIEEGGAVVLRESS
jgi:beta-galactosidase